MGGKKEWQLTHHVPLGKPFCPLNLSLAICKMGIVGRVKQANGHEKFSTVSLENESTSSL